MERFGIDLSKICFTTDRGYDSNFNQCFRECVKFCVQ